MTATSRSHAVMHHVHLVEKVRVTTTTTTTPGRRNSRYIFTDKSENRNYYVNFFTFTCAPRYTVPSRNWRKVHFLIKSSAPTASENSHYNHQFFSHSSISSIFFSPSKQSLSGGETHQLARDTKASAREESSHRDVRATRGVATRRNRDGNSSRTRVSARRPSWTKLDVH